MIMCACLGVYLSLVPLFDEKDGPLMHLSHFANCNIL